MATLMDEIMRQYQPSAEERAYAEANPDRFAGLTSAIGRSLVGAGESTGAIRAPSFQRLAQAAAMSQAINPARAEIGNQALSQAASNRAQRDAARGSFVSSAPSYGEPEGLERPMVMPSGPSTPMGQIGSVADQRAAFEKMAGIGAASQPNYFTSMPPLGTPQQQRAAFEALAGIQPSAPSQANPLAVPGANTPVVAGLDAANRPAPIAGSASVPNRPQGFFEQLFKGPQYQSNNLPVGMTLPSTDANPPKYINWGDPNSAADFFRADALLRQQNPSFFGLLGGNNG